MAKNKSLADLGDTDLRERLGDAKEELFNLRFQLVTGQLENHARMGRVKKEVARVLTELGPVRSTPPRPLRPPARRWPTDGRYERSDDRTSEPPQGA